MSWTLPLPRRNAGKILISSERSVRRQPPPGTRAAPQPNPNGSRLKETPTGTLKWHPAARTWWSQTSPPTSSPSPSRSSHPTRRPLLARKSPAARPPAPLRTARLHPSHRIRPSKTCCGRGSEVTLTAWPHQPTSSPPLPSFNTSSTKTKMDDVLPLPPRYESEARDPAPHHLKSKNSLSFQLA